MLFFGFNNLKFFNLYAEYFIAISLIYVLVVFVLLISNVYGLIIQKANCELMVFILFLSCFFCFQEQVIGFNNETIIQFSGFNKFVKITTLTIYSKITICFFCSIYFLIISTILVDYKINSFDYVILVMFATLGLLFLCITNDFITTFLAIELISLSSYLLAAFRKTSSYSLEAGIKYLIVGAVSSSFFLYGTCLIYCYTGAIAFNDINFLITNFKKIFIICNYPYSFELKSNLFYNTNFFIEIGAVLVLFSIYVKLALAPFHLWSLDVYEGSPSISTFFFSTMAKLSFFVFLYNFFFLTTTENSEQFWFFFNIIVGFFSIFFGAFGGLRQKKIKTLLAYSSISHMGYSLLSFSTFSKLGFEMLYFYLFSYMLASIIVWFIVLNLKQINTNYKNKLSKDLGDFVLLSKTNWFLSFSFSVAFFSLAGIPPLAGFLAKFNVFLALVLEQFYTLALLTILCSVISSFYYLRIIKILYFENLVVGNLYQFKSEKVLILSIATFLLAFFFIKPTLIYLIVHKMILFEGLF